MGIKASLKNKVARHLFSPKRRDTKRRKFERQRRARNAPHVVEYYHEAGDPYSHLLAQVLPEFCQRYDIELSVHVVPPPSEAAAPDRERLEAYARVDAQRLADRAGLQFINPGAQPHSDMVNWANAAFLQAAQDNSFLNRAAEIGTAMWRGEKIDTPGVSESEIEVLLAAGAKQREARGHYLGATLHYGGEWYWGVDRLHYLEARLQELGAGVVADSGLIFPPPDAPSIDTTQSLNKRPELHWYLSFRSPYTGIVADRVKALADAYGADLKLRYVLPMVMRGMSVPREKGFYIMSDAVREAERLGVSFGNMSDPVRKPVERGYAILHQAIELEKGFEFARSFLSGVWAEGIDAGTDRGLKTITERAGVSWNDVRQWADGDHWRSVAEENQAEMFGHGIWGVPSFRVNETATWGQDRLWVIEEALAAYREVSK